MIEATMEIGAELYASADGFIGKVVTISNVENRTSVVTGKVTDVTISSKDEIVYVHDLTIESVGKLSLWTPFEAAKTYASKHWYWIVDNIA